MTQTREEMQKIIDVEFSHYEKIRLAELDADLERDDYERDAVPFVVELKPDVASSVRRLYGDNLVALSQFINKSLRKELTNA